MRRIYSSPRMENIERLVALMAEHGIATRVTNVRVYDSKSYSRFSYARLGSSENWPSVWVERADDHTRARQIMRDIGIEPPTRFAEDLAAYRARKTGNRKRSPSEVAAHVRTLVLVAVAIAVAIYGIKLVSVW